MADRNIKPRFKVVKLPGTVTKQIAVPKKDKQGTLLGGFDYQDVEVDAGWMVYLPSGSSFRCWSEDELVRMGLMRVPGFVDMETGDEVNIPSIDLEERAHQVERSGRKGAKAAQI